MPFTVTGKLGVKEIWFGGKGTKQKFGFGDKFKMPIRPQEKTSSSYLGIKIWNSRGSVLET